jgi:tyrocidine synthetase-3
MNRRRTSDGLTIAASHFSDERDYWLNKLAGDIVKSYFPYDYESGGEKGLEREIETVTFAVSKDLSPRLTKASKDSDSRLFMILAAGLVQLLRIFTGTEDIIVGIPISKQAVEGELLNTMLPVRISFEADMTFRDLLMKVRQTMIEAGENQNYPLEMLPNELNMGDIPDTGEGEFPLFDIILLLENIHDKSYIRRIRTNMVFSFVRAGREIKGVVEYNALKYQKETVKRIYNYFMSHLYDLLANPDMNLSSIDLLSEEDRQRFLFDFNRTETHYPADKTIQELFEVQAAHSGDKIAVVSTSLFITYNQLNEKANHMARLLREKGIKEETAAAVMGHRSPEMMAVLLGILKAGGAYLPINAQDPIERITYILNDSKAHLLMTDKQAFEKNSEVSEIMPPGFVFIIEDLFLGNTRGGASNPGPYSRPGSPAYIIYTSGTTGKPKGVIIEQKSLVNYIFWAVKMYVREKNAAFPFYTSFSFDMSITSIFTPLVTGNAVVIYGGDDREFILERVIEDNRVGVVKVTPSHLKMIREKELKNSIVRRFIVGGEQLETHLAREISEKFNGDIEIYNEYGPTEATVGCMIYKFSPGKDLKPAVPVGIPMANTKIYLLHPGTGKPIPIGVSGELFIAGDGVARGYLNNPELTAEKFPPAGAPLSFSASQLLSFSLYRTGDLARRLPDGNIEFIGRRDKQVKIRGFRIELAEIESQLLTHEDIKNAAVTSRDNLLCAYIVSDKELAAADLREYLSGKLPDYMVPSYFVKLDAIPLTANGKIDARSLPEPQIQAEAEYVPPGNETERKLLEIWSEVLGIAGENVSIDANFFEIGGHSLSATVLVTKIHMAFNVKLLLLDIFKAPTIRGLSGKLAAGAAEAFVSIEPVEEREYYPLSSAQERLYVTQQMDLESKAYNITQMVTLEGQLEKERFEQACQMLVDRHESLRTSFTMMGDEPVQRVHKKVVFIIDYLKSNEADIEEDVTSFSRPFDLAEAPNMRVGLVNLEESGHRHVLIVEMHHIVADGVSMAVLMKDFMTLYSGEALPPLGISYKDFSRWENSEAEKEKLKNQEAFWMEQFRAEIPELNLPTDYQRSEMPNFEGKRMHISIVQEEYHLLKELALKQNTTLYMVIFSVYLILLSKLSGQEDIVTGTVAAGRRHLELQQIVGMFVNTLALRNYPRGEKSFMEFLGEVSRRTLDAFENQEYPFGELVDKLAIPRATNRNPLFDVMFSFENIEVPELNIPGLTLKPYNYEILTSQFDMNLLCVDTDRDVWGVFEYSTDLFKEETIDCFIRYFKAIITSILDHPDRKLSEIEMIPEEKEEFLSRFIEDMEDE